MSADKPEASDIVCPCPRQQAGGAEFCVFCLRKRADEAEAAGFERGRAAERATLTAEVARKVAEIGHDVSRGLDATDYHDRVHLETGRLMAAYPLAKPCARCGGRGRIHCSDVPCPDCAAERSGK